MLLTHKEATAPCSSVGADKGQPPNMYTESITDCPSDFNAEGLQYQEMMR